MQNEFDGLDFFNEPMQNESALVSALAQLLASSVSAKFITQGYHWNVRGRDFREFHEFFQEIYEDFDSAIDPLAENIRKLGVQSPYLLPDLILLSQIHEKEISTGNAEEMLISLVKVNAALLEMYKNSFNIANELNEQGIANFLAERIDMHHKWNWQLTSTLGI